VSRSSTRLPNPSGDSNNTEEATNWKPDRLYVNIVRLILTHKDVAYSFQDLEPVMGQREHLALHPFNRVPILKHDDLTVYETSAIASYVDEAFGGPRLTPQDVRERARMNQWISAVNSYYYPYMIHHVTHERLVFPEHTTTTQPNPDLPDDIVRHYEEARSIVDLSPRAAAALLPLAIQKLCAHLGESGKDLNNDIKNLVAKGLDPVVQQSLDIVRVIGNESVHPGTIDLNDDRETALRLFDLVNAIADQMISHPKKVQEMYAKLPEEKRKAVEARDAAPKKHI